MFKRRTRRVVVLGAALLAIGRVCAGQEIPPTWGPLWQPRLPPQERHPYLFYDDSDRQRILNRIEKDPWARWWKTLERDRRPSAYAFRWWLTGDEALAREARAGLVNNPIFRQRPQGYLEPSSHPFADYVAAYDTLAAWKGLTAEDHKIIRARIAAEADYYYGVMAGVRGGANYGNQRTLGASALGMAALTLCQYKESVNGPERWLARALHEIRRDENLVFFRPGGLFVEGAGYTTYMSTQFVPFAIAYERASGSYLFEEPIFREWLTFAAYQMMADGEVIPWGTCETQIGMRFFGLLSNRRYGRDLAPLFHHAFNLAPAPPAIPMVLALYENEVPGDVPPPSRAFPESQAVVLRGSWGHDTVGVWFEGKERHWRNDGRVNHYRTYSHGDAGHFVIEMADEVLASDSGYDHWKSKDYFGPEFHNVILIDGQGPQAMTFGDLSDVGTEGSVRHATVASIYQGCTVRRTLALVRGRYVLVADRITADAEHEYTWQVRSTSPPGSEGTLLEQRAVIWPALAMREGRQFVPGKTQLTTVAPPFATLTLTEGRWRPISAVPEFSNQVALAKWKAQDSTALFVLIPNLRAQPDVTWQALKGQDVRIKGPGWTDTVKTGAAELEISSSDGQVRRRLKL